MEEDRYTSVARDFSIESRDHLHDSIVDEDVQQYNNQQWQFETFSYDDDVRVKNPDLYSSVE
jgi:hypothetical protein